MFLDRFTDKEANKERKLNNKIALQADAVAEYLAASVAEHEVANREAAGQKTFNIGRCPQHLSVEEFASRVGHAAIDKFPVYSFLEKPSYSSENTRLLNMANPEIGAEGLASIPPPPVEVRVVFERAIPKRILHSV